MTPQEEALFHQRLARHHDELRWLYMELYDNGSMFAELCDQMYRYAEARSAALKARDAAREADPQWYKHRDLLGMMLYIDNFAGNLNGVRGKLDYLEEAGVNCLHLMPFLDTVKGRDDGGYAVADFRTVRPDLGTMDDLEQLTAACHDKGMNVCMDFVMNHTSCDHEWARRALAGDGEYMSRYFFFDNYDIPAEYEKDLPPGVPHHRAGQLHPAGRRPLGHDHFLPLPVGPELRQPPRVQRDDVQLFVPRQPRHGHHPHRRGALYLERAGHQLPQPAPGPHHCADDADDRRDRLPQRHPAGRSGHGAGQGGPLLRHRG